MRDTRYIPTVCEDALSHAAVHSPPTAIYKAYAYARYGIYVCEKHKHGIDRRKPPPGGRVLSDCGVEEEI